MRGENLASEVSRDLKFGDDGHGLDFLGPRELDVASDAVRRLRWGLAGVNTTGGGGEDLG